MKIMALILFAIFAVGCVEEETGPKCDDRYIRLEDTHYEVVCDGDVVSSIERTKEAMTEACGDAGWMEGDDWICAGWLVTSYGEEYRECDCSTLSAEQTAPH